MGLTSLWSYRVSNLKEFHLEAMKHFFEIEP